jgi:hypothetical protein
MGAYDALLRGEQPASEPRDVIVPEQLGMASDTLQSTDDAVRAAANAATLNYADRVAGALTPGSSAAEQARLSREARVRSPLASIGGDVAGAAMLPGIGGRTLAARLGGDFAARAAGHGAEGAVYGALSGGDSESAAMGGLLGMGTGGFLGASGRMQSAAKRPAGAELQKELDANYVTLRANAGRYEPQALFDASFPPAARIQAERYRPEDIPYTTRGIEEMRGAPSVFPLGHAPVSPADIDLIRRGVNQAPPGADRAAGRHIRTALDEFLANPPPGAVMPGTEAAAAEASALAKSAVGNTAGQKRVQAVEDLIANAETRGGTFNVGDRLRGNAASFTRRTKGQSPASKAGLNPEEIASFENFAKSPGLLGYAGSGIGMAGLGAAGLAGGGGYGYYAQDPAGGIATGLAAQAVGPALRMAAGRGARKDIGALRDLVSERTPLFRQRAANAPMVPPPGRGSDIMRNLMTQEILKQQQE